MASVGSLAPHMPSARALKDLHSSPGGDHCCNNDSNRGKPGHQLENKNNRIHLPQIPKFHPTKSLSDYVHHSYITVCFLGQCLGGKF